MASMIDAFELLRLLTARLPPPKQCRHSLLVNEKGKPIVSLALRSGGEARFANFLLDEADLLRTTDGLAEAILWQADANG